MILTRLARPVLNEGVYAGSELLVRADLCETAPARARRSRSQKFFVPQTLCHSTCEQKAIQRTLIFSQHAVRSTCGETNAHQTEFARAISCDCIDQIKALLL
jgi:hypothetical protein